jgi:hypothetical protein
MDQKSDRRVTESKSVSELPRVGKAQRNTWEDEEWYGLVST